MGQVANPAAMRGAAGAVPGRRPATTGSDVAPLKTIPIEQWRALQRRAVEPNGYLLADWELAVNAHASGRTDVDVLCAWSGATTQAPARLIGLLPVISCRRAFMLPLPALVSADPYGTLTTPLLDRDAAEEAVAALLQQARNAGARALILRDVSLDGAAMHSIRAVLDAQGLQPHILQAHQRACLDASRDADELLRDALGSKKLKELRRQRNRLSEHGEVHLEVARTPAEVAAALEHFLALEAGGWKGKRGTALADDAGDKAFISAAAPALAGQGQCEIVTLYAGATPVASAIMPRHLDRAFYFKLGIDERFAKSSPGVQLTLEVTRHLCEDPTIASADSTAAPGHPMIDPIWRTRLAIGDVLIPLRARDPMVGVIHAALTLRSSIRERLRRVVRMLRGRKP